MMSSSSILLVAALLSTTPSCCTADNVYCVTPTATSCSFCPHNSTKCTTLSEYAQEPEVYFTSDTTIVFLPGNHSLDVDIRVANVARLTIYGESSTGNAATVVCIGSVGLSFTSMVEFKMQFLTFHHCGRNSSPHGNYALLLQSTQLGEVVNCSFHKSFGTALVANDTNITLAGNDFTYNHCESNSCVGGGVYALSSNLTFLGNTTFLSNSNSYAGVAGNGGAICASQNTVVSFNGTNNFINNSAVFGGAIYTSQNTVVNFHGINNFINNSASYGDGGAIYTSDNTILSFTGRTNFTNNSAVKVFDGGGAIYAETGVSISFDGTTNFIDNSAVDGFDGGGAICAVNNVSLRFNGTTNFTGNSVTYDESGGAIYALSNVGVSFNGINSFTNNSAGSGGAIYTSDNVVVRFNKISNFIGNSAVNCGDSGGGGGAIYSKYNATLSFNGNSNFLGNSAFCGGSGGAVCAINDVALVFMGSSNLADNFAYYGGAVYTSDNVEFSLNGIDSFIGNSARYGGALFTNSNSRLRFNGTIIFINNGKGDTLSGGGMYLGLKSTFSILPLTTVYWENNRANLGGAIYVTDSSPLSYCTLNATYLPKEKCFFQLPGLNLSQSIDVQLVFKNNSADAAGGVLYGGAIDNCKLNGLESNSSGVVLDTIAHIEDDNTTSGISSDPFQVCLCENNHLDCSTNITKKKVFSGETFHISVVALGQRNGTVPAEVVSTTDTGNLLGSQYSQKTSTTCTKLTYTVFPQSFSMYLKLYADGPCSTFGKILNILLDIKEDCPPGFEFEVSSFEVSCICDQRIAKYTNKCNITNGLGKITRDRGQRFWVGYDNHSYNYELIIHPQCPVDYCVKHKVVFSLNNTDAQCTHNRRDLLCGRCEEGYSLGLGTSKCWRCTNSHLFLLIPFALMGVALVLMLFVCKLTVAMGTLSGLVFYANIIGVNRAAFIPVESTNAFNVFLAWLNLDFGIETCFYNGMDAYTKAWLQFVFPVYIWVMVGLMIGFSRYSQRFANLLGNNPVSVLATLILFSYTKILRTLIAVINITYLEYPYYNRGVWLYDANIDYLSGKHIPLFIVAVLVFLFLFLPYTLLLLFGQWLQAISHLRLFSWVNSARLKPFMDSYHAPYKAKHRYWPGLLLMLRFTLLLVFALNTQHDTSTYLLTVLVVTGVLHLWAWVSGGVYRNWCLDALEGSFTLNLIILAGATYHVKLTGGDQLAVGYTSVSIAFVTFTGILVYHIFLQWRKILFKKIPKLNLAFNKTNRNFVNRALVNSNAEDAHFERFRESLLEDQPQPSYGAF